MKIAMFISMFLLCANIACASSNIGVDKELETPKSTVLSYCKSNVFNLGSKYFNLPEDRVKNSKITSLGWKDCKIVEVNTTKQAGTKLDGRVVKPEDVEVTLSVLELDARGKWVNSKFWFLLRDYGSSWKIISYAAYSADTVD